MTGTLKRNVAAALGASVAALLCGCSADTNEPGMSMDPAKSKSQVCGESGESFFAGMSKMGDSGVLSVTIVEAMPAPPARYDNTWTMEVLDAEGNPVDDATLRVSGWMPEHGHGTPRDADIVPLGDGRYEAAPINLFMPGLWRITVEVSSQSGETDATRFLFCVTG